MCGIGAIMAKDSTRQSRSRIEAMMQKVVHRGPDDHGLAGMIASGDEWLESADSAQVWLGHRRLSIVDLSEHGRQPMKAGSGECLLTFNGELYNYLEIRAELVKLGAVFRTQTDSEVLLQAYQYWGPECLVRFKGMFAFVIFDPARDCLFVARDFFGIKPLYFVETPDLLALGSECKMLLGLLPAAPAANPRVVHDYLYRGRTDIGNDTFFADVQSFPAAHYALIDLKGKAAGQVTPVRYWMPGQNRFEGSLADAAERVKALLFDSVRIHLRSDVPIGANISGGLDSSSVINIAPHFLPQDQQLQLFTYSSDDAAKNEDRWVNIANSRNQWPVRKVEIDWATLPREIDDLVYYQDYPFASLSMFAENQIYKQVNDLGLKVMLGGQGADEYLAGYWPYVSGRVASLVSQLRPLAAIRLIRQSSNVRGTRPFALVAHSARYFIPESLQPIFRKAMGRPLFPAWMDESWFRRRGIHTTAAQSFRTRNKLHEELLADMTETSLFHHLRSEDRSSMQYSIESRVPFLEPELVDFVLSLPEDFLIADTSESKFVLRQAMKGVLPEEIRIRNDKIGFETGAARWLEVLADQVQFQVKAAAEDMPFLNRGAVATMLSEARQRPEKHSDVIWRIYNLQAWSKTFNVSFP